MKAVDLRLKTEDELVEELTSLKKEAFNLRFQLASGQLENTARTRQVRRSIARIKSILTEKKKGIVVEVKKAESKAKKASPKKAAAKKTTAKKDAPKKAAPKKAAAKKKSDEGDK